MSEQVAADIRLKITELVDLDDEDLKDAMQDLKKALLDNPDAVALMLPVDIGEMVKALRRITGEAILSATKKPAKKASKKFTAEEMQNILDEL